MSTNSNTANKTLIDKDAVEKNISSRDKNINRAHCFSSTINSNLR